MIFKTNHILQSGVATRLPRHLKVYMLQR